ncbi:MAG: response regulator transcription factor [Litorilinea sp.]
MAQIEDHPDSPSVQRILVVDDAAETRLMLGLRLEREGYQVHTAPGGTEALEYVRREGLPNLVLLDILMPGLNGFAVAESLRAMGDVPIIFLSALSDATTIAEGINRYAEDYVTKPFAFPELLARIRRVLLRVAAYEPNNLESVVDEHLRINFTQHYAVVRGDRVSLTPTETRLLHILYANRGRVLSPQYLMTKAWDPMQRGTVGSLWVHVRRLRSKIEANPESPAYLITVRGQGYCLEHSAAAEG